MCLTGKQIDFEFLFQLVAAAGIGLTGCNGCIIWLSVKVTLSLIAADQLILQPYQLMLGSGKRGVKGVI